MLDSRIRPLIDPPLQWLAEKLAPLGISANAVTWAGFAAGLAAILAISQQLFALGLVLLWLNRIADGVDGAIARLNGPSDLGGFLDITLDFIIYSGIVFAFALADPAQNALTACFLILSFMGTGGSFLAFAVIAAKRGIESQAQGKKSIYYLSGLAEGSETILVLSLFCLLPNLFVPVAPIVFALICGLTTIGRIRIAMDTFD